jgi:hypothetical protein
MLSGEIAISNVFGTVLTSGTGVTSFMIHQGNKKRLTDVIKKSNIISVNAKGYDAATEQVDFIGYNGTSGAIVAANETDYFVRMNFVYGERGQEFPQQNFLLNHYKSDASATQIEIAKNLSLVMNAQARKRYERDFKVEIICDNAGAAITGTATTWTVSQDSKTIALDGTVTNVVAGDFVRLGGLTVGDPLLLLLLQLLLLKLM